MKVYNVKCFATATVTANDEQHAREILGKLANQHNEINIDGNRPCDDGGVYVLVTIAVRETTQLEFAFEF